MKIVNTPLDRSAALVLQQAAHWHPANLARNLARAGLGRISEKWPDLPDLKFRTSL